MGLYQWCLSLREWSVTREFVSTVEIAADNKIFYVYRGTGYSDTTVAASCFGEFECVLSKHSSTGLRLYHQGRPMSSHEVTF